MSEGKIVVLQDYCVRVKGADCSRCETACPKEAIGYSADGMPVIDAQLCTQCGICLGICDSFSSTRVTMLDLHERVRSIALRGETVHFTCKENIFEGLEVAANVVILPCLACLSPEFWTVVLSENIQVKVACDLSYCADCERAGENAEMLYTHAIKTGETWSLQKVGFSRVIPEKENLLKELASNGEVDRRSAFTNIVQDVSGIATGQRNLRNSEVLQRFVERRERSRAMAKLKFAGADLLNDYSPTGRMKKIMFPKRQMIIEAVAASPEIAARIPLFVAEIDPEICAHHKDCLRVCPTGAISPNPENGEQQFDVRYCIGCELCVAACPTSAIRIVEESGRCLLPPVDPSTEQSVDPSATLDPSAAPQDDKKEGMSS